MRPGTPLFNDNWGIAAINYIYFTMCSFGNIIGVIIGCSVISSERTGNALNTLIVKPLFRDTIINGKLLGAFLFYGCVILFYIAIFTSGYLLLCGSTLTPYLADYFARLPFVFLFILVYILVFLSISMLISLLIRDQAFAMILSVLAVNMSMIMHFGLSSYLDNLFPEYLPGSFIASMSPDGILWIKQRTFMSTHTGALQAFLDIFPDFTKLVLYSVIAIVFSYILFLRRDIS